MSEREVRHRAKHEVKDLQKSLRHVAKERKAESKKDEKFQKKAGPRGRQAAQEQSAV
jgi:hypothetical protein